MALVLLVLGGTALLALPGAVRRVGRRLDPAEWSRLCLLCLVGGAVALEAATILVAAPTVARALGVPAVAEACERMLRPLTLGGPWAGWTAAALAFSQPLLAGIGALRARRMQRRFHIEPWLGHHEPRGDHELVVLPTDTLLAVAVAVRTPQIVISQGLLEALPAAEMDAVLRHEAAHLDHGHHRFLLVAAALDHTLAGLVIARRGTQALRAALERWADESAAGARPERRAEVRGALLGVTRALVGPAIAAFSAAETVLERLDALDGPPPRPSRLRRAGLYGPSLVGGAGVLVGLGIWAGQALSVLAMAGRCPA